MSDELLDETRKHGAIESWLTRAWSPSLSVIIITAIIAFLLPILLHLYLYQSRTTTRTPIFLVAGPSGAGKTALLTSACTIPFHKTLNTILRMLSTRFFVNNEIVIADILLNLHSSKTVNRHPLTRRRHQTRLKSACRPAR